MHASNHPDGDGIGVVDMVVVCTHTWYGVHMMSSRTTNARRRAVERAVKQAELKRARVETALHTRMLAGEPVVMPSTFTVAEAAALSQARGY